MARRRYARGNATTVEGVRYRSAAEAEVAKDLIERGVEFEYEKRQVLYEKPAVYVPDFEIETASGKSILVEFKGWLKPEDRSKLLAVKETHPRLDLRLLFQRAASRISKAAKALTYGAWATRHGFKWAEGVVPQAWLEE
jgi:predicted nuclease of restriction endonuclease-like RecB superfamily